MMPEFLSFRGSTAIEDKDGMALVDPMDVIWETVFEKSVWVEVLPIVKAFPQVLFGHD